MIGTHISKKLYDYRFKSSVSGHIEADYPIFENEEESYDLDSEQMAELYERRYELQEWAEEHEDDLIEYLQDRMSKHVSNHLVSARFGELEIVGDNLFHFATITTSRELTDEELDEIHGWVNGQLTDGWGEGASQTSFNRESFSWKYSHFHEYTLEVEECEEYGTMEFYCNADNFIEVEFAGVETKEEQILVCEEYSSYTPYRQPSVVFYCCKGWDKFVDFCNINELHPLLDGVDGRDMAPGGNIYVRAIGGEFDDSPVFYEDINGGITVERLGGQDHYGTMNETIAHLLFWDN